jgi:molybdopterin molybdotransferase
MTDTNTRPSHDVRMHGFTRRQTVQQAIAWLDAQLRTLDAERVPLRAAAGRVLAAAVVSEIDVPGFDRATMDGYAVVADSTEGATPYNRIGLKVIGEALPGSPFGRTLARGEAVRIMTGAPIPAGCDAVLPAESVDADDDRRGGPSAFAEATADTSGPPSSIAAISEVSPSKNIGRRGEDIVAGTTLLEAGRVLRPQDLGVMSSIGLTDATVVRRPRVRLVITGNELLPSGSAPQGFQITDANGPMLAALAERDGAIVDFPGLVRDEPDAILAALRQSDVPKPKAQSPEPNAHSPDIIIVSGGSSVGIEDHAPALVAAHGELAVHGVAMRPSSPTGMGRIGERLIFLLPGNPVSALCAYDFFAGRAIRALGGRSKEWPYRSVRATLSRKISSPVGRLDYARVKLDDGRAEPLAVSGASVLSSTTRADGFVLVDQDSEGFAAGSEVIVWLYA